MASQSLQTTAALFPMGVCRLLGGRMLLGLLALMSPAAAELCEDGQCMLQEQATGAGISLMQSGSSVLPLLSTKGTNFGLDDALVDEFATMEDEFDGSFERVQAVHMESSVSKHRGALNPAGDAYFDAESLLVNGVLALVVIAVCRQFTWDESTRSKGSLEVSDLQASQPEDFEADSVEPTLTCAPEGRKSFTALEQSVRAGDESACLELLKQGGRWAVHQEDPCGCTALHVAAHCGSTAMTRLLLNHGAKVDACEMWDETPLHIAARSGSLEVCEVLLAHGANIDAISAHDLTPLLEAGHSQKEAVCEFLLSHGAGAGGAADTELPPLVNSLLFQRMLAGTVPRSPTEEGDDQYDDAESAEEVSEADQSDTYDY